MKVTRSGGPAPTAVGETGGAVGPAGPGAVEAVFALQEAPDATDEHQRKQAKAHGDDLLDQLEAVRRWILAGAVPKDKLAELARQLRAQRRRTDDPRLEAIIDEIELRAEVEIAKLTRGG
jgi:N-acetylglucosamine kinase-like BadF-type ATPase